MPADPSTRSCKISTNVLVRTYQNFNFYRTFLYDRRSSKIKILSCHISLSRRYFRANRPTRTRSTARRLRLPGETCVTWLLRTRTPGGISMMRRVSGLSLANQLGRMGRRCGVVSFKSDEKSTDCRGYLSVDREIESSIPPAISHDPLRPQPLFGRSPRIALLAV